MFDLRLLGWTMRKVPVSEVVGRLLPWTIAGFVVMVISGTLLFFAIPLRSYQNIFFRFKMILLLLAGLNVWIFHSRVYPKVADVGCRRRYRPRRPGSPARFRSSYGSASSFSGRMIAYNWFDCDRQPQPAHHQFSDQLRTHRIGALMSLLPFFQWCYADGDRRNDTKFDLAVSR